jgi:hypothetical protein
MSVNSRGVGHSYMHVGSRCRWMRPPDTASSSCTVTMACTAAQESVCTLPFECSRGGFAVECQAILVVYNSRLRSQSASAWEVVSFDQKF